MRPYTTSFLLLLALLLGSVPQAYSQSPTPGSCLSGQAEKDLDINNVLARMFNTGSLFYGGSTTNGLGYLVPQASGNPPIFASGIWIGGIVDGTVVAAGSRYDDFEFWPGPLNDDGTLPDPNDCAQFDRIYKVSQADILNFDAGIAAAADLAQWPAELGAPVLAARGNGFDDDGDGLVDEGEDGVSNDDDNKDGIICPAVLDDPCLEDDTITPDFIDERNELERAIPSVRQAAGRPVYDLAGGDRPEIIGNQALWWVMNDLGNTHLESQSPPIGVEAQVLAFSFARADALNDVTFYRYRIIKKTPGTLEETFFSIFSDPDLGDATDDFVGVDTTLSLGFVYNAEDVDNVYGVPPATGYDFFQGPIVDADGDGERDDTLGVTRYSYFQNIGANDPRSDPANAVAKYNFMQGLWGDGVPLTEQGDGYQTDGEVTLFAFPGNPVTGEFWSEENPDGNGVPNPSGDRRFLVTTGPFDLEQGVAQDIVFGIVFGQGGDRLSSIDVMRQADALAQAAYDADFELAAAPPPPTLCDTNSPNAALQPGGGGCLEAIEVSGEAALVWGYPETSSNFLGSYEIFDQLIAALPDSVASDKTYNFEGFNIYQYPNANFEQGQRAQIGQFDVINGVTQVIDTEFDPAVGDLVPFVALDAQDTGIRYTFDLTQLGLVNYTDYYFGITAFAYNEFSTPKIIESAPTNITVRPSNVQAGNGGSVQNADLGDAIVGTRTGGGGSGTIIAEVVDPTLLTGATYTVEFFSFDTGTTGNPDSLETTFRILRDGSVAFDGQDAFEDGAVVVRAGEQRIVVDGIEFTQAIAASIPTAFAADAAGAAFTGDAGPVLGSGFGIVEVANPNTEVCAEGAEATDIGCRFEDYLGGNTVWLNPNSTDDYVVTNTENNIADLGSFVGAALPDDFEMRFTSACASPGSCLAVYASAVPGGNDLITSVPFELWNVRNVQNGFEADDVRMIPILRAPSGGDPGPDWTKTAFGASQEVTVRRALPDGTIEDETLQLDVSHRVLWTMPDRPDGYAQFAAAANGFGGVGATYDPDDDGDMQVDPDAPGSDNDCRSQGYYIDFCYKGANNRFVGPVGGLDGVIIADLAGDGTVPPAGTTIAFQTSPKPALSAGDETVGDVIVFETADLAFETNVAEVAEEALDLIGIVPNPYMGRSAYETDNLDRVARFINLPDEVLIRIYTVSGTLIRTLRKDGPARSLDWDLNTHNQLPVASGMYLIHIDAPGIGEKVLKFGVVNRRNRITIF
ncbi:MAG: hypothetical protein AAGI91_13190 [Bacteroidota bacterium]